MELCAESIRALYKYWIGERNYARDCRWTQAHYMKKKPDEAEFWSKRHEKWDARYKYCDSMVRAVRKL